MTSPAAGMPRAGWRNGESILLAILVAITLLLAVAPVLRLVLESLFPAAGGGPAIGVLKQTVTWTATRRTLEVSIGGTLLAALVGMAMALLAALTDIRARPALVFGFVLPLMIPPQVTAIAWLQVFGPSSPLLKMLDMAPPIGTRNPLYSRDGIILLLGIHYAPLVFLTLRAGLRRLPRDFVEAALATGASPLRVVATVIVPIMIPALIAGVMLTLVSCIGNFGIPALLGLPVNYLTLPTLIYRRLSSFGPSVIGDAAAVSLLLIVLTIIGLLVARRLTPAGDAKLEAGATVEGLWKVGSGGWVLQAVMLLALLIVLVVPLASLLAAALVPTYGVGLGFNTVTLGNFAEVLVRQPVTARAFVNSLVFSALAAGLVALLALPLGYVLARHGGKWRGLVEGLFDIPYALPGVVLALACILLMLKPLPLIEISLYGTPFIIIFAYVARFLPLALKPVTEAMGQFDTSIEEAASICGAGPWERLRYILAPAAAPTMAAGALLAFLIAFNELTVSALLWSRGTETLGVVLFSLEEAGLVSAAAAVALSAVAVVALVMVVLDRMAGLLPEDVLPWR